jgi:hypothetical protein
MAAMSEFGAASLLTSDHRQLKSDEAIGFKVVHSEIT